MAGDKYDSVPDCLTYEGKQTKLNESVFLVIYIQFVRLLSAKQSGNRVLYLNSVGILKHYFLRKEEK